MAPAFRDRRATKQKEIECHSHIDCNPRLYKAVFDESIDFALSMIYRLQGVSTKFALILQLPA